VSASGEVVEVIVKKEDVKVDNLGERGDELEECEAVGDSNDKLANGVEGEGNWGSESGTLERDDEGSLPVKTRGEFGYGIDETVVGSCFAGIEGGGMSFASVSLARQIRPCLRRHCRHTWRL
jgi:hypothetical protein